MAVPGGPGAGYPGGYAPRPQVRFEVIGQAWQLFTQQAGQWVVAALIAGICVVVVRLIINLIVHGIAGGAQVATNNNPGAALAMLPGLLGLSLIGSFIATIVSFFFQCGLFRMAARQIRGELVSIGDLFSVTDVLPAIIVGAILYTIAIWIGLVFCCVGVAIPAGLLMFTGPLIADRRLSGVEALSTSWSTLMSQALMAIVFAFVLWLIIVATGIPTCGIATLVTIPLAVLSVTLLYRDFFPDSFSGYPGAYPTAPAGTEGSATGSVYAPTATPPAPTGYPAPAPPAPQTPTVRVEPAEPAPPPPPAERTAETTPPPTGAETPPPPPGEP